MAHLIARTERALVLCQNYLKADPAHPDSFERFTFGSSSTNTPIRASILLFGDLVYEAELKTLRPNATAYHAIIKDNLGSPYKLQQIQDCSNYVTKCLNVIRTAAVIGTKEQLSKDPEFINDMFRCIRGAIDSLTQPPRKTVEEHMSNPSRRCFHPPIPKDLILSFFVRGPVLVFASYVLGYNNHEKRWEIVGRTNIDCLVPRLQEVLRSLQLALDTISYLNSLLGVPH